MATREIAEDLVAMCKEGKFAESGEKYWADARAKGEWWSGAHDIHGVEVAGPWVNGDQFTVRFTMDITNKQSGQRMNLDEIGLYTLRDGKIAEERFFYAG